MGGTGAALRLVMVPGTPTVVTVDGSLDLATVNQLEAVVAPLLTAGASVVLDLAELAVCDSTGLGALVRLQRQAGTVDGELAVRRPRPHVADVFAMTGINKLIPIRDD